MTTPNSSMLDSLLAAETVGNSQSNALKVTKSNYEQLVAYGNLSSYSMDSKFNSCPRKFAISKMQAATGTSTRVSNATFAFGHSVGAGVATFDESLDLRKAIWSAFLAWDIDLLEEETNKAGKLTGKSFWESVWALYAYEVFHEQETDLADYDVVNVEAVLTVDFEDGHFYSGHIDELLQHKESGAYRVKENKTTSMVSVDPVMYSNSDQALSYAVVVDSLGATEYEVMYTIYSSKAKEWVQFSFVKNANSKAAWLQDQLFQHQHRDDYSAVNFFPMRGASCFNFMRRCEYYGTCDLNLSTVFGMEYSDLPKVTGREQLDAIEHVDFYVTLSDLISRQKQSILEPL